MDRIAKHCTPEGDLAATIAARLTRAGRDLSRITTADLAAVDEMESLLAQAGFEILRRHDSSDESLGWFEAMATRTSTAPPPAPLQAVLGDAFPAMVRNQIANLRERRIRTVGYLCRA